MLNPVNMCLYLCAGPDDSAGSRSDGAIPAGNVSTTPLKAQAGSKALLSLMESIKTLESSLTSSTAAGEAGSHRHDLVGFTDLYVVVDVSSIIELSPPSLLLSSCDLSLPVVLWQWCPIASRVVHV